MKNKKFKIAIVLVIDLSVAFVASTFADTITDTLVNEYSNMSEEEFVQALSNKSFNTLVAEMNALKLDTESSDSIHYATVLSSKARDLSVEELRAAILNTNNSIDLRGLLLQIADFNGTNLGEDFLEGLVNSNDDFYVRYSALVNLKNINPMSDLLEEIALADDELSFYAIKFLNKSQPNKAQAIADDILENFDGNVTEKVRAAIKAKASEMESATKADKVAFIELCDEILKMDIDDNELTKDTVIFALSDSMCKETISYIITSDVVDPLYKGYCIDQNYKVLASMVNEKMTTEDMDIVLKAMEIYPITEMKTVLSNITEKQGTVATMSNNISTTLSNDSMVQRIEAVIEHIEKDGVPATNKY